MEASDQDRSKAVLTNFGLYYPFIHFRDESWLKMAALYWPRMARVVPPGYQTRDSDLVQRLSGELGFVVNVDPSAARASAGAQFIEMIEDTDASVIDQWRVGFKDDSNRYGVDLGLSPGVFAQPGWSVGTGQVTEPLNPDDLEAPMLLRQPVRSGERDEAAKSGFASSGGVGGLGFAAGHGFTTLAGLHHDEVDPGLLDFLRTEGLVVEGRAGWWGVSPSLAWVYKCELTDEIAERNRLTPTTDDWMPHVTTAALTGNLGGDDAETDIGTSFGLLALKAVVPENLESVSVKKIVEVRRKLGPEFDRWRAYVDDVGALLSEQLAATIDEPNVIQAYLEDAVRRYSTQPVEDLRRGLRDVGLEAGLAQVSSRFAVPAILGAATGGLAPVAAGIDAAAAIVSSRHLVKTKAREQRARPVAYLLDVSNALKQRNLLDRMMAAIRYGVGLSG